jgi:hypothetical protein
MVFTRTTPEQEGVIASSRLSLRSFRAWPNSSVYGRFRSKSRIRCSETRFPEKTNREKKCSKKGRADLTLPSSLNVECWITAWAS